MEKRDNAGKFVEVANRRVNKAIKSIELVSNLANTKYYEYSDKQVKKIVRTLQKELDNMEDSFRSSKDGAEGRFSIK
ncbi:MAG: hypothetical protein ACI8ZB_003809 [Desulforhopalus sp.]|jgi:hypothetical protein